MTLFPRISRYILWQCLSGTILVISVLMIAILLVDVVEQLRTVGGDVDLTAVQAVQLSLMKMPMLIEQTIPFALLIAAMIAYSRLNRRAELSIIRASGMSAWRFLTPLIAMALFMSVISVAILNPLGAHMTSQFEGTRAQLLRDGGAAAPPSTTDIWLRQGSGNSQIVIHAERLEDNGAVLAGVKLLEEERIFRQGVPTDDYRFVRRIDAARARITDGFWQLEDLVENVPGQVQVRRDFLTIPTSLDASQLLDKFASPNTIGFWELPQFIQQTSAAGLDSGRYRMRFWGLTATPVLYTAMALIGALVCLRLSRLGGTSQLLAIGALSAIGVFFVTQLAASLGSTGAAPPLVAAWSPALFALFACLTLIAYREDG
ncbi:MAG: LPS export ABC transporter permease LptG [Pseudomonadota bacterium]